MVLVFNVTAESHHHTSLTLQPQQLWHH